MAAQDTLGTAGTAPIERRKLSDLIEERLLARLQSGELSPGDALPSERELMEVFGTGRPAVPEAMQNLERMGLIEIRHGERPRVAEPGFDRALAQLGGTMRHVLMHSADSLEHLKEARAAARIERLEEIEQASAPSLPGAQGDRGQGWRRAHVTLSWPLANIGPSLPNLIATVAGNLFELRPFSGLRLLDVRVPRAFAEAQPGPVSASRARGGCRGSRMARLSVRSSSQALASRPRTRRSWWALWPEPGSTLSRMTSFRPTAPPAPSTTAPAP